MKKKRHKKRIKRRNEAKPTGPRTKGTKKKIAKSRKKYTKTDGKKKISQRLGIQKIINFKIEPLIKIFDNFKKSRKVDEKKHLNHERKRREKEIKEEQKELKEQEKKLYEEEKKRLIDITIERNEREKQSKQEELERVQEQIVDINKEPGRAGEQAKIIANSKAEIEQLRTDSWEDFRTAPQCF